ncbi:MAG: hypothetical protein FOGNACKC_01991 [Anaerolineae bacterium]|nr:hypothetical protein [Anaerolineae bacterium]
MDPWGGQSEFIGLTIKPEDAQNGVITFISTNYGPCSAAFGDIPVELEEGEIKFNQFTSHGSVVGSIKVDKDKIAVLIDDFYCTDDLFGVLTRKE